MDRDFTIAKLPAQPWDVIGAEVGRLLDSVTQTHIDTNERSQDHFHPSTVGYCPRKTVMERLGYPKQALEPRIQRIFENGHAVHERITAELAEAGILVLAEVPVHMLDENCAGHTDGIGKVVFAHKGGVMILIEIKSANAKSYHWVAGGAVPGDKTKVYGEHGPPQAHLWQVQLYLYMTGILYGVIITECKDCQERHYFTVKYDRALVMNTLLPIVALVNAHVAAKTLPPRDRLRYPDMTCFDCTYCDYQLPCAAQEAADGVIDLVPLLP